MACLMFIGNVSHMTFEGSPAASTPRAQIDVADQPDHESDLTPNAERALVASIRDGDIGAFTTLATRFANRLIRFAFHIVGSRDTAEEVVQLVFVYLWEHRASIPLGSIKSYLFSAVRNRALNERRADHVRNKYRTIVQAEAVAGTAPSVVPSPERAILTSTMLQEAIERLPERRRIAVRLRFDEDMTNAEIAEVLGISLVAAKQLMARAIADLRNTLSARV